MIIVLGCNTVGIWILQIKLKIQSKKWWSLLVRVLLVLNRPCFFYLWLIFILCWLFWLSFSYFMLSLFCLVKTVVLDQSYAYDSMTWSISDSCWSLQLRSLGTLPLSIFCSFIEVSWNLILSFWFQVVTKPLHSQSIKLNYKLIEIL